MSVRLWGSRRQAGLPHRFPPHVLTQNLSICHLEALNALVAIKLWAPQFRGRLIHLFSDNVTSVAIFQAGRGRDAFIQACAKEVWLTCAAWDITLAGGHVAGNTLEATVDALSRFHLGQPYRGRAEAMLRSRGIACVAVPYRLFVLTDDF